MKIFEQVEGLASNYCSIIKTVVSIVTLETRLAGLSVYPLLLNICMLLIILMTVWASGMLILGYYLNLAFKSPIIALAFVLFTNLGLFFLLLNYLKFNLKSMSFEKTRDYFSNKGKNEHGDLEKTSDLPTCRNGKKIGVSPK